MKTFQHKIEYYLVKTMLLGMKIFPVKLIPSISWAFGSLLFHSGVRKKVLETNLRIAFGQKLDAMQLRRIRKETCLNAASIFFEFLFMYRLKNEDLSQYITVEGLDLLEEALLEEKGAIVAGNHFAHWELVTAAISQFGEPLTIFTGLQKNKLVDDIINQIRQRFGTQTISKAKTQGIEMMKALKKNKPLGMAGDLNVPHDNLFVDFFGKKAVVGQGLATFTLRRKAPLLFIWNERISPMCYKGYIKRVHYQITGDSNSDLLNIAQLLSTELEDKIRQHPGQYFWFNRRWKTRPSEEQDESIY